MTMQKPNVRPDTLCMAPWVHTYLSPHTERRMCCASREPAQNFRQYIDTASGSGEYIPITLDQHWNSEQIKSVRRRMMAGETLPECEVCNDKLLNFEVYRNHFHHLFKHKYDEIWDTTDESGATTMQPISWDYRFSNLCNFKCRMCGDVLSSAWETESRQHNMFTADDPKNSWRIADVKKKITEFQEGQVEAEFAQAVEEHRVEEIYWVGGEPLMFEQHWRYMKRIIELGDGPRLYARYNSNLSRIEYKGIHLFRDILANIRDWQMCASIDGTGAIGEYIRTGLEYDSWLENFKTGIAYSKNWRQMRLDFTLTLPGMFEVNNMQKLASELGVGILSKVVFAFSPDIVLSPLALPKHILHPWIDELLVDAGPDFKDLLTQLKTRPTFAEQWPDTYKQGLRDGKERILRLEQIRTQKVTMTDILGARPDVLEWWMNIGKD